jgi:hypothetical protein
MKMNRRLLLLAAVAVGGYAQTVTADAVLDRFVEVSGGKAAFAELKSMSTKGTIEFVGQGIKGTVETYALQPNNSLTVMELAGIGKITSGVTNGMVWQNSAIQGARIAQGDEAAQMLRSTRLDAPVKWREIYPEVKLEGTEDVDGKAAYKVSLKAAGAGEPQVNWYDKESGLLVQSRMVLEIPMGKIPVVTKMLDYEKMGGFLEPRRLEQKMGPQTLVTVITSVERNPEIAAEKFALPAEIEKLAAKKK